MTPDADGWTTAREAPIGFPFNNKIQINKNNNSINSNRTVIPPLSVPSSSTPGQNSNINNNNKNEKHFKVSRWRVLSPYVERNGVEFITQYKYHAGDYTMLDNIMNPFWEFLTSCCPRTLAPNMITLFGFGCVLLSAVLYILATPPPYFISPPPNWFYLVNAFLIFAYQTLDAMDGKQARRTQSFSPLGTLMDHGCDIVSLPLISFTTLGVLRAGTSYVSFLFFAIAGQALQFCFFWMEYQFGVFSTNSGFGVSVGVTEAQFGVIFLNLIGAFYHGDFYVIDLLTYLPNMIKTSLSFVGLTELPIGYLFALIILMNNLSIIVVSTIEGYRNLFSSSSLKFDRLTAVGQVVHNWCYIALEYVYYSVVFQVVASKSSAHHQAALVACGMLTLTASYSVLVLRLLLSSTCRYSYAPIQWPALPFEVFAIYIFLGYKLEFPYLPGFYWVDRFFLFFVLLLAAFYVWILTDLLLTSWRVIADHLGINVFTINPSPPSLSEARNTEKKKI